MGEGNMTQPKVSIIIPYIRPKGMERCKEAIFLEAGVPTDTFEVITAQDHTRIGPALMLKELVDKAAQYPLIMFLGDDTIPEPDFLRNALEVMKQLPDGWGLVGLNDGRHNGDYLATHWLGDRRMLPLLDGEFFHTGYWHCFCDNELTMRAIGLGRYMWASNARVQHLNPVIDKMLLMDKDYHRVYSAEWYYHDHMLFLKRMNNGWKTEEQRNESF